MDEHSFPYPYLVLVQQINGQRGENVEVKLRQDAESILEGPEEIIEDDRWEKMSESREWMRS
jgi:hypothetical protein